MKKCDQTVLRKLYVQFLLKLLDSVQFMKQLFSYNQSFEHNSSSFQKKKKVLTIIEVTFSLEIINYTTKYDNGVNT